MSLARSWFTALDDCAPHASVKVGDGRLLLAREPSGSFDALFLDAFASGSIPVHLLTLEALEDYLRVLEPDGALVVHISNRHLDLEPLLGLAATELGLAGAVRLYTAPGWSENGALPMMTHLAVLARHGAVIDGPRSRPRLAAARGYGAPRGGGGRGPTTRASLVPYLR